MRRTVWIAVLLSGFYGGCDDGGATEASTTGGTTTDDDDVATTIPVTSVSATMPPVTSMTGDDTTGGGDTDTTTGPADSSGTSEPPTGSETGSTSTGDDTTGTGSTSTGSETSWEIGWCNLQFPATIEGTTATQTPVFSQLYIEELTTQSPANDVDPLVVVEFGFGADGSDPAVDAWTWFAGEPNEDWDGSAVGAPNNDEYTHLLTFDAAGVYDYAARVSGDGGTSWSYCDLDGLVENGYTPDQAGSATIE